MERDYKNKREREWVIGEIAQIVAAQYKGNYQLFFEEAFDELRAELENKSLNQKIQEILDKGFSNHEPLREFIKKNKLDLDEKV